jgi:hypothetical protein
MITQDSVCHDANAEDRSQVFESFDDPDLSMVEPFPCGLVFPTQECSANTPSVAVVEVRYIEVNL